VKHLFHFEFFTATSPADWANSSEDESTASTDDEPMAAAASAATASAVTASAADMAASASAATASAASAATAPAVTAFGLADMAASASAATASAASAATAPAASAATAPAADTVSEQGTNVRIVGHGTELAPVVLRPPSRALTDSAFGLADMAASASAATAPAADTVPRTKWTPAVIPVSVDDDAELFPGDEAATVSQPTGSAASASAASAASASAASAATASQLMLEDYACEEVAAGQPYVSTPTQYGKRVIPPATRTSRLAEFLSSLSERMRNHLREL